MLMQRDIDDLRGSAWSDATIAESGVYTESDPRELVDDLAGVAWWGLRVGIIFDADDRRNPNVNHARAELARVLTDLGADVRLIDLPVERASL